MRLLFILFILAAAGALYLQPQLALKIPLPQDPQFEDKFVADYLKTCPEKIPQIVASSVDQRGPLTPQQFQDLLANPNFQKAFCDCQGEIIRHERFVPSAYLPAPITEPATRKLASTMAAHLKSPEGHKQTTYCYIQAWNKAAFAH